MRRLFEGGVYSGTASIRVNTVGMYRPKGYGFWAFLGLKTGNIHFAHFGLESGVVFEGTAGVYERLLPFQFQMNKNEMEMCEFEIRLRTVSYFSLQNYCTQNLRTRAAKPLARETMA